MLSQCCNTNHQKNRRTNFMNQADRESVRQLISQKYCRCIGQHHAQSGPEHDPEDAVETCCQCDRSNLGFVTNFCQKKQNKGCAKDPEFLPFIDIVKSL